jgi:membrane protease YdiL (CAAX protease family)
MATVDASRTPAQPSLTLSPHFAIEKGKPLCPIRLINPLDGPMGEEPGWRGYALPRLFSAMSPLPAAAVLGLIVAAWHLPLVLMGMLSFFGLPATFAITFVYCWLFNRTGGSVLLTLVFHATEGAIRTDQLGLTEDNLTRQSSLYALCWCVVAVAVILLDRKAWRVAAPSATADQ